MKHVLHLSLPPRYACGVTRHVWTLAREQRRRFRVTVCTPDGPDSALFREDAIDWLPLESQMKGMRSLANAFLKLRHFVVSQEVTLIHAHHRFLGLLASLVRATTPSVHFVETAHAMVQGRRWLSYRAERLIAVSEPVRRHLIEAFGVGESRITVIMNAPPPEPGAAGDSTVDFEIGDALLVAAASRLSPEKGIGFLVSAMARLRPRVPPARLVVMGDGPEREALQAQADALNVPVIFLGALPSVRRVFRRADVVVQPSLCESSSLTMLEAGLARRAFVGSHVGGLAEAINSGRNGLLVPPGDSVALGQAIDTLLDRPELRERLGNDLYRLARERGGPEVMAASVEQVYASALRAKP